MTPEAQLRAENELVARLLAHGANIRSAAMSVTEGDTTAELRKQRFRAAIKEYGLEAVIASTKNGVKTYADVFRLVYGEAL